MAIWFVLVLSIIGTLLALAMYANLLPFIGLLWDIKQYNMAYYGAESSIERAFLVLRHQEAWFQGESGYSGAIFIWPLADQNTNLWLFIDTGNSIGRQILGRGPRIPTTGNGNIPQALVSNNINNYNFLPYGLLDRITLWYDSTIPANAYSGWNSYVYLSWSQLELDIQLNQIIANKLWSSLYTTGDGDGDGVKNDVVLDRSWKGKYNNSGITWEFSILPKSKTFYGSGGVEPIVLPEDGSIRESIVNDWLGIKFWAIWLSTDNTFNPIYHTSRGNTETSSHLIISDYDNLSGVSFKELLGTASMTTFGLSVYAQEIWINLVNPLSNANWALYPGLEYEVTCPNCWSQDGQPQLSQPYFTINAWSIIGAYDVRMTAKKPVSDNSSVTSFTVIF